MNALAYSKSKIGQRSVCRYCGQDIEFHGRNPGWIDRGANRGCSPFIDNKAGVIVRPKTKHAPSRDNG